MDLKLGHCQGFHTLLISHVRYACASCLPFYTLWCAVYPTITMGPDDVVDIYVYMYIDT